MTSFAPSKDISAENSALDKQVESLRKESEKIHWLTRYLAVTLHFIGGHTQDFDFDRLYIASLHGDTTVFFEAKTLSGELIKREYDQVEEVTFEPKTRPESVN